MMVTNMYIPLTGCPRQETSGVLVMLDFNTYMMRHGEHGVQAIIERIERVEGVGSRVLLPLEVRWNALMGNDNHPLPRQQRRAA
jgi:hypothetical protein